MSVPQAKYMLSSLVAFAVLGTASAAQAGEYIDYWGDDLFIGLAYHRFGCYDNDTQTLSSQEYDGFTTNNYCFTGQSWDAPEASGYTYLGYNETSGKAQLDACGKQANTKYGTANYAASSTTCSYNVLMNCNSDCWIREFSKCQGAELGILSPCLK